MDPDEKLRAAVCRLYSQLEYEVALHHVSESQWRAIAERGLDKKVIGHPALPERPPLLCLGHCPDGSFELHRKSLQFVISRTVIEIPLPVLPFPLTTLCHREVNDPAAVQHFSWIPGAILSKTPPEVRYDADVRSPSIFNWCRQVDC